MKGKQWMFFSGHLLPSLELVPTSHFDEESVSVFHHCTMYYRPTGVVQLTALSQLSSDWLSGFQRWGSGHQVTRSPGHQVWVTFIHWAIPHPLVPCLKLTTLSFILQLCQSCCLLILCSKPSMASHLIWKKILQALWSLFFLPQPVWLCGYFLSAGGNWLLAWTVFFWQHAAPPGERPLGKTALIIPWDCIALLIFLHCILQSWLYGPTFCPAPLIEQKLLRGTTCVLFVYWYNSKGLTWNTLGNFVLLHVIFESGAMQPKLRKSSFLSLVRAGVTRGPHHTQLLLCWGLGTESRVLCEPDKHCTEWTVPPSPVGLYLLSRMYLLNKRVSQI